MSKKFFSLICGDKKISSTRKIVPAEAIAQLLEAEQVLENVKSDAEKYKQQVAQECEKLKIAAKQEGFAAGYQEWANQLSALEAEIQKVRSDMEKRLIPVALKAAQKILGKQIELSEETIVDIVSTALKAVSQHKKITIYVNKKDLDPLEKSRSQIKNIFENLEALSIRERPDIARGGCIIETEGGIINAELENQWAALEKAFTSLMKSHPSEPKHS